jgi:hypothetical protein
MKEIVLTKGYTALVDDSDFARVSAYNWYALVTPRTVYAKRNVRRADGKQTTQYLHRFILGITNPKVEVDHENHVGTDCQRDNLRDGTKSNNQSNRQKNQNGTSQFKGVSRQDGGKYRAHIRIGGKRKHLGYHTSEANAAIAYDRAAKQAFGEFSCLNFPVHFSCGLPIHSQAA